MKKASSQASGSPTSPGVASLALTSRVGDPALGGLHLFPHPGVQGPAPYVSVDVRPRLGESAGVVELERADQLLRGGLRLRVCVAVAVVVLQPRARLRRAPRIRVGM